MHLADEEHPYADEEERGQPVDERIGEKGVGLRRLGVELDFLVPQRLDELEIERRIGLERFAVGHLAGDEIARDGDAPHFAGIDLVDEFRIADGGGAGAARLALKQTEQREEQKRDDDPDCKTAKIAHINLDQNGNSGARPKDRLLASA